MQRSIPALTIAVALLVGSLARAATIDIQFTGMNLEYDASNGIIFDAGGVAGGGGDPADSDPLSKVEFFVDNALVGTLSSDIWIDVFIDGVTGIPAAGGLVTTPGQGDTFGFDLLVSSSVPGWGLALNLDEVSITYVGNEILIAGGGTAASVSQPQNLPFGLELDTSFPINFAFLSTNLSVTSAGGFLTSFTTAGTGSITGTLIPEPASAVLVLCAALGALISDRRRPAARRVDHTAHGATN